MRKTPAKKRGLESGVWKGEEELVRFLAPYVNEGRLVFKCRDGTAWGYSFDGRGNVRRIEFIERLEEGYFFQAGAMAETPSGVPLKVAQR